MAVEQIISDEKLAEVWGNANFGTLSKRDVVRETLLKCACGYHSGHTAKCIVEELGLVHNWRLTRKGKEYLYEAYEKCNL